jgi:general L-amino acid transport system permease protein
MALLSHPRVRAVVLQVLLVAAVAWLGWTLFQNAQQNLAAQNIATGLGFLESTAGFGISQTLIHYEESSTYGRAFVVGLLNTLLVAGLGIVFATILGFVVGIARLSPNILLARIAGAYVELVRNLPLLFQILFWYIAVLSALPGPRASEAVLGSIYLTNRGLLLPRPVFEPGAEMVLYALLAGAVLAAALAIWAYRRRMKTGAGFPTIRFASALAAGPPLLAYFAAGMPIDVELPELRGFNFVGGLRVNPEFAALLLALSTYTAGFIAEIVRAGILAVERGQTEAAYSLGLKRGRTLRFVVVPQALYVIVPPLTSQYLNLTKNSSLAVAIGYPDFFAVFAGTTLNQTGQAIEIVAITMGVYLAISLATAALMNWYNRSVTIKGAVGL